LLQSSKQDAKILKKILIKSSIVIKDCLHKTNYESLTPLVKNIDKCLERISVVNSIIDDYDDDEEEEGNNNINNDKLLKNIEGSQDLAPYSKNSNNNDENDNDYIHNDVGDKRLGE